MLVTMITVKVTKHKLRLFEYAVNMSKWPGRSGYIGNIIYYLTHLPDAFPRGLEVDLEGSSTFLIVTIPMNIDRLGLFCYS